MGSSNIDSMAGDTWRTLFDELCRRTREPLRSPTFMFYSFLAIVVFAGAGIWIEVIKIISSEEMPKYNGIVTAVATFSFALNGAASHRLILSATGTSDKLMSSFSYTSSVIVLITVFIVQRLYELDIIPWYLPVIFAIIPIWIWWIANGDDPVFQTITADAASGGDTDRDLPGSLKGFEDD